MVTFTVTTLADSGAGSLRQAIIDANTAGGANTIAFTGLTNNDTIVLASDLPAITANLTIDASNIGLNLSGVDLYKLLTLQGSGSVTVNSLSLVRGGLDFGAGGTLTFEMDQSFSGVLAPTSISTIGTAALLKTGTGSVLLKSDATFAGGVTISAGILNIGGGSAAGSLTGNVVDNGQLSFNRTTNVTYGGTISGSGDFSQAGTGTVTLTGANTYSGFSTIGVGTLALSGSGTLGTGQVTVVAGATLDITASTPGAQTFGNLAGAGSVVLGAKFINVGNSNALSTFSGVISGTGGLFKIGSGSLILSGANTYSGGTAISAGLLQIGDGTATSGSITGNITNNAALAFNRPDNLAYNGNIGGTGTLAKSGAGIITLGGTNTFIGGTTITSGTLSVTGGAALADAGVVNVAGGTLDIAASEIIGTLSGAGAVTLAANILTTGTANDSVFSGVVSGTGGLVKQGAGTLDLTGTDTYTGATTVAAGKLLVDGSIGTSSLTTVQSGAILGGSGSTGHVAVNSGGTLAAGTGTGTGTGILNTGDLDMVSGATLEAQLGGTTNGSFDKIVVAGAVDLAGVTLSASRVNGFGAAVGDSLTIIDNDGADAVSGVFNGLTEGSSLDIGGQSFKISYVGGDGNDVTLTALAAAPKTPVVGTTTTAPTEGGTVQGTAGADLLTGQGGADTFFPGGGADTVDGGAGIDKAVFTGTRDKYTVAHQADGSFTVSSISDTGTVAVLKNVERIAFDNQTLALDVTPTSGRIAEVYQIALGRNPEEGGLGYYVNAAANGVSTFQMAAGFVASPEFSFRYGPLSDSDFLFKLYDNAFGRTPDAGGLAFHLDTLAHNPGLSGRAAVLAGFLDAPEMTAKLVGLIDQGIPLLV